MRSCWAGRAGWMVLLVAACGPLPPAAPAVEPAPVVTASAGAPEGPRRAVFAPAKHLGAALSLTASDGTGLRLVSLRARSVVTDPLAFTELHLAFENPQPRVLEGTFRVVLPQGASVSRISMKIGETWQEGEVVEAQAARQAYEDFLHRRQDPALLEQAAGNEFSARVFPIPAAGVKELVISYSQELTSRQEPFRLPLGGLPQVERIEAEVYGSGGALLGAFRQEKSQPEGDFLVELTAQDRAPGLRSGELVVARVAPVTEEQADVPGATLLLVDTSASRALGFDAQLRLVEGLVRRIERASGPATPVSLVAFDQVRETIYEGPASGLGAEALERLRARGALGASGLAAALQEAAVASRERGWKRLILVSDGVITAGDTDGAHLREQAAALRAAGVERLDAVAVGGIRDDALLRRLATAGLERDGVVADGALPLDQLWRRLSTRTRSGIPVQVEGARWWSPTTLDGLQSGDEVLIHAEMPSPQDTIRISVGGRTLTPALAAAERPLLERSMAKARIDNLLASAPSSEVRAQVIALSTQHRVLSPFTSLLVLETEQDYARHKIERSALANILMIQQGKLSVEGRKIHPEALSIAVSSPGSSGEGDGKEGKESSASPAASAPGAPAATAAPDAPPPLPVVRSTTPAPAPPTGMTRPVTQEHSTPEPKPVAATGNMWGQSVGDSFGAGGLGLSGVGEGGGTGLGKIGSVGQGAGTGTGQGFGMGSGRLAGSHRTDPPQVRMGAAAVSGRLAPEIIQRIVRQNFGRFRFCYENGLRKNPNLQGRIAVRFVIGKGGEVAAALPGNSTLLDAGVVNCVANSFRTLQFPQPEGGIVTVVYPINFAPGGGVGGGGVLPATPERPAAPVREVPAPATPYSGRFGAVMAKLSSDPKAALADALAWRAQHPADVLALLALGEAQERLGARVSAARAYGSLIDLFPARADLRRYAAARLERLEKDALPLAIDSLRKAREQRPDHPSSHRMLAMALLRGGHHEEAFQTLVEGLKRGYPPGRFLGYERILGEDLGLIAAAWKKAEAGRRVEIDRRLKEVGGAAESGPSLRFVLTWETDANDVDFHIYDDRGNHAYFDRLALKSGGSLYADVTTGYGPECFTVRTPAAKRPEYTLQAHYYSRGPMGYGMGSLQIIEHDGNGNLTFEERPFVVMEDRAYIDLGKKGPR